MRLIKAVILFALLAVLPASAEKCDCDKDAAMNPAQPNIVELAQQAGSFKTLLQAASAAGLAETLAGKGPFTVFAPTDEAFAKLPPETLQALLDDPKKLSAILLYHVVPGTLNASSVLDKTTLNTAQGADLKVSVVGDAVMINGAKVLKTDLKASNGVVHVIDTVLIPPSQGTDQ